MVDCRPAGAPPHDMTHNNGAPDNQHQPAAGGELASHARAPTPAAAYQHAYNGEAPEPRGRPQRTLSDAPVFAGAMAPAPPGVPYCAPYPCGVKSLVWCAPPAPPAPHAPPPPPPGVNPHVYKSLQPSGADLPMNGDSGAAPSATPQSTPHSSPPFPRRGDPALLL